MTDTSTQHTQNIAERIAKEKKEILNGRLEETRRRLEKLDILTTIVGCSFVEICLIPLHEGQPKPGDGAKLEEEVAGGSGKSEETDDSVEKTERALKKAKEDKAINDLRAAIRTVNYEHYTIKKRLDQIGKKIEGLSEFKDAQSVQENADKILGEIDAENTEIDEAKKKLDKLDDDVMRTKFDKQIKINSEIEDKEWALGDEGIVVVGAEGRRKATEEEEKRIRAELNVVDEVVQWLFDEEVTEEEEAKRKAKERLNRELEETREHREELNGLVEDAISLFMRVKRIQLSERQSKPEYEAELEEKEEDKAINDLRTAIITVNGKRDTIKNRLDQVRKGIDGLSGNTVEEVTDNADKISGEIGNVNDSTDTDKKELYGAVEKFSEQIEQIDSEIGTEKQALEDVRKAVEVIRMLAELNAIFKIPQWLFDEKAAEEEAARSYK